MSSKLPKCTCGQIIKKVEENKIPVMYGGGFLAFVHYFHYEYSGTCGTNGCKPKSLTTLEANAIIHDIKKHH